MEKSLTKELLEIATNEEKNIFSNKVKTCDAMFLFEQVLKLDDGILCNLGMEFYHYIKIMKDKYTTKKKINVPKKRTFPIDIREKRKFSKKMQIRIGDLLLDNPNGVILHCHPFSACHNLAQIAKKEDIQLMKSTTIKSDFDSGIIPNYDDKPCEHYGLLNKIFNSNLMLFGKTMHMNDIMTIFINMVEKTCFFKVGKRVPIMINKKYKNSLCSSQFLRNYAIRYKLHNAFDNILCDDVIGVIYLFILDEYSREFLNNN